MISEPPIVSGQQLDHMTGMLNNSSTSKLTSNIPWLLDYGVSRHMTGQRNCLLTIVSIPPCYVELPNGASRICYYRRLCQLGSESYFKTCLVNSES